MATRSVDVMLSKPGIYVVCAMDGFGPVEVGEEGFCWALHRDTLERQHPLTPGGWRLGSIVGILGPFARVSAGDNSPLRANLR